MNSAKSNLVGFDISWDGQDSEFDLQDQTQDNEFKELLESYNTGSEVREGSIVEGLIVGIANDCVQIDIGHKTDGEVPVQEFKNSEGEIKNRFEPLLFCQITMGSDVSD